MTRAHPKRPEGLGVVFCLATLLLLLLVTAGCERCSTRPVAVLAGKTGQVERDFAASQDRWEIAQKGAEFSMGDAVRTGVGARAALHLDDGSTLALEEQTRIRFLDRKPGAGEQAIDLQLGRASLEAPAEGAVLRTVFGLARLEGGARVQLVRRDSTLRYEVALGAATVESLGGSTMQLAEGQTVVATLGKAVLALDDGEEAGPLEASPALGAGVELAQGDIQARVSGGSVRLTSPGDGAPRLLPAGDTTLVSGSVLEVGDGSQVALSRGHESAKLEPGGSYVVGAEGHLVAASSGSLTISSEGAIRIKVPGGFIVTRAGSAKIRADGAEGTHVRALAGSVSLVGKSTERLAPGEEGSISPGGEVSAVGGGLSRSDLDVNVGQSLVIHDPRPPTAVGFVFGDKCEVGVLRLSGKRSSIVADDFARGRRKVALGLGPGRVDYRLSCLDQLGEEGPVVDRGTITVLQDSGSKPVPVKAPSTFVDVNGRSYTVLYQNQLPQVTVRWSSAPSDVSSFKLIRTSGGASRSYPTTSASYTFRSGALGEGTHTVYFEGGGRVSRRSNITILFDNATPAASLQTPAGSGVSSGGTLRLAGTGLPGWTVTVDGKSVGQDADGRFAVTTTMPSDGRPAAVVLTHPSRGAHVYLRRPASGP